MLLIVGDHQAFPNRGRIAQPLLTKVQFSGPLWMDCSFSFGLCAYWKERCVHLMGCP